jgi:hypothetical protein
MKGCVEYEPLGLFSDSGSNAVRVAAKAEAVIDGVIARLTIGDTSGSGLAPSEAAGK